MPVTSAGAGRRARALPAFSPTVGLLLLTVASWAVYAQVGNGFLSSFNLFTLSQLVAETAVIGAAQLVVVATGRLNLAVGAVGAVTVMSTGWLAGPAGVPLVPALLIGVVEGAICGAVMGVLERVTGLGSFIVTLAMASVYTGIVLIASGGAAVSALPEPLTDFGANPLVLESLSWLVVPMAIVYGGLWLLYRRTRAGWQMLAVGANERAASLGGVPTDGVVVATFALSGALSAVAAIMEMSRVASALPSLGSDWLLLAFVVPVLGGTALRGGAVALGGALVAALFVVSINSGLVSLGVNAYWQEFAQAVVLLLAILADRATRRTGDLRRSHAT